MDNWHTSHMEINSGMNVVKPFHACDFSQRFSNSSGCSEKNPFFIPKRKTKKNSLVNSWILANLKKLADLPLFQIFQIPDRGRDQTTQQVVLQMSSFQGQEMTIFLIQCSFFSAHFQFDVFFCSYKERNILKFPKEDGMVPFMCILSLRYLFFKTRRTK